MKARWILLARIAAGLCLAAGLSAPCAAAEAPPAWPASELTVGFQSRHSETEGIGDLLVPLWNPGGNGLLFVNPRSAFTDHSAEEYNVGLGYRQLLPNRDVILGANAYFDYRDTRFGSYKQWGVGLELLTPWVDARANYYDPENKKLVVGRESETTTRRTVRTVAEGWGNPYASGNAVVQDYVLSRRVTTETATRVFEQYQQPLGGYDLEIGLRLPLPVRPETFDARVFAGYYDFDRDFGADAKGWKARAELRLLSSLFLDAGVYENDDLYGSDWFAGARLAVPLDLAAISQGRNPFSTARSRLERAPRDFSARLTEMVMRDPQIRLETSKFIENKALSSAQTSSQKSSTRQRLTLLPDVVFAHGDAGGGGVGTGERPFRTIQEAADAVFGSRNVYVFSASGAYEENVVLQSGTTLWGSGLAIPGAGGKVFGGGTAPIVDGLSMGPSITMADRTTVKGFHVRNTDRGGPALMSSIPGLGISLDVSRVGIFGNNATDLTIARNNLTGNSHGALLMRKGDFNLVFSNNASYRNDGDGLGVVAEGNSGSFAATIVGGFFFSNGGDGASLFARQYDVAHAHVERSTFMLNAGRGLDVETVDAQISRVILTNAAAAFNGLTGIEVAQVNGALAGAMLSNVDARFNGGTGIRLLQDASVMAGTYFGRLPEYYEAFPSYGDRPSVVASRNGAEGIVLQQESLGGVTLASLIGVEASSNALAGISLNANASSDAGVLAYDVHAHHNADAGISHSAQSEIGTVQAYFIGVRASGNVGIDDEGLLVGGDGIRSTQFLTDEGFNLSVFIDVETANNDAHGIYSQIFAPLGSAASLFSDVRAIGNSNGVASGTMATYAGAALTDSSAAFNLGNGFEFSVFGLMDSSLFVGNGAAERLDDLFDTSRHIEPFLVAIPQGEVMAAGNDGNGLLTVAMSPGYATTIFDGVAATANGGDGIEAITQAFSGDSIGVFSDVYATVNQGHALAIQQLSIDGMAVLGMYDVFSGFNQYGIVASVQSMNGSAFGALAGITALDTFDGSGIQAVATAGGGDAAIALTDVFAAGNSDRGVDAIAQAEGNAYLFIGSTALDDMRDDPNLSFLAEYLIIPEWEQDAVVAIGNESQAGIWGMAFSLQGDVHAIVNGVVAHSNATRGVNLSLAAAAGDVFAIVANADAAHNDGQGVRVELSEAGDANVWFEGVRSSHNSGNGIVLNALDLEGRLSVGGEGNVVTHNGERGIWIRASTSGMVPAAPLIDFGGGGLLSAGQNSIFGNGSRDFAYNDGGGATAYAQHNWWGVAPPVNAQFNGNVDRSNWLLDDPNAP